MFVSFFLFPSTAFIATAQWTTTTITLKMAKGRKRSPCRADGDNFLCYIILFYYFWSAGWTQTHTLCLIINLTHFWQNLNFCSTLKIALHAILTFFLLWEQGNQLEFPFWYFFLRYFWFYSGRNKKLIWNDLRLKQDWVVKWMSTSIIPCIIFSPHVLHRMKRRKIPSVRVILREFPEFLSLAH